MRKDAQGFFSRQPLGEGMENFLGYLLDEKNEPH